MGLAAAEEIGKSGCHIVLIGRTPEKLDAAVNELQKMRISAERVAGDVAEWKSMQAAAAYAAAQGEIVSVVHCAGVSPKMAAPEEILKIDAIGTIHVGHAFLPVMKSGSCLLNVASMAAHLSPMKIFPFYRLSETDALSFFDEFMHEILKVPPGKRNGMAYQLAKQFVIWFSKRMAVQYGKGGVRVCSISPGHFHTPMENFEGQKGTGYQMAIAGALGRVGEACEIGRMMAFMVSPEASYLTGTDLLYDGGTMAAIATQKEFA